MAPKPPALDYILPALRPLAVPVSTLSLDPTNARRHPPANLEALAASLRAFGQRKPLVVTTAGVVLTGNATLVAARDDLGWTHLAVVPFTGSPDEAAHLALADNRSAELASWNPAVLPAALREALASTTPLPGWAPADVSRWVDPWQPPAAADITGQTFARGPGPNAIAVTQDQMAVVTQAVKRAQAADATLTVSTALRAIAQAYLDA